MFQWAEKFLLRYSHKPINTKNGFDIFPQTKILINVEMTYKVYQSAMWRRLSFWVGKWSMIGILNMSMLIMNLKITNICVINMSYLVFNHKRKFTIQCSTFYSLAL